MELNYLSHVRCGNVWLRAVDIGEHLAQFSEHLFYYTQYVGWELSRRGSCLLILYRNRHYVVATYHQIKGWNADFFGISSGRDHSYVTGAALYWDERIASAAWDDAFDLAVLDYTETVRQGMIQSNKFYSHLGTDFLRNGEVVVAALIIGFANADQRDDISESSELDHMLLSKRILTGRYRGDSYQSELFFVEDASSSALDVNGISGSPVFLVCGVPGAYYVKLAGNVIRAGNGKFHCLKHTVIRRLLDQCQG